MFFTSLLYLTLRAVRTHIGKSPAFLAASIRVKEIELETRCSDAMVGGAGAVEQQDPQFFRKQNEGFWIWIGYCSLIWNITRISHNLAISSFIIQVYPRYIHLDFNQFRYILGKLVTIMGHP